MTIIKNITTLFVLLTMAACASKKSTVSDNLGQPVTDSSSELSKSVSSNSWCIDGDTSYEDSNGKAYSNASASYDFKPDGTFSFVSINLDNDQVIETAKGFWGEFDSKIEYMAVEVKDALGNVIADNEDINQKFTWTDVIVDDSTDSLSAKTFNGKSEATFSKCD